MTDWSGIVGAPYARPGTEADRIDGLIPPVVVRPGSAAEVAQVVVAAGSAAVVASGLGAHLDIGGAPRRLDVLLRLDRLDRIVEHSAADMTVVVEAGCPLLRLAAVLDQAGQWLPLDPPRVDRTTAGGLVAANLWGPLRASQGSVRDLLLGLRVVAADGARVSGGGRVVKNVAGYDLPKLHVGALGTLGVLTEVTFRVQPRPPCELALVVPCRSALEGAEIAMAVRERLDPLWLAVAGPKLLGTSAVVLVGLGGISQEVAEARSRVGALVPHPGRVVSGSEIRRQVSEFPGRPAAAMLRVSVKPADVGSVLGTLDGATRGETGRLDAMAHVATGVVHVAIPTAQAVPGLLGTLRAAAARLGGTVVVERARPEVKPAVDVWGDLGPGVPLMRRLKATLDPTDHLAPGRLL